MKKRVVLILILGVLAAAIYYFFVDTVTLSEVVGDTQVPALKAAIALVDRDTGLTRYQVWNFQRKMNAFKEEARQIGEGDDPDKAQRRLELAKRMVGVMQEDPVVSKMVEQFKALGLTPDKFLAP